MALVQTESEAQAAPRLELFDAVEDFCTIVLGAFPGCAADLKVSNAANLKLTQGWQEIFGPQQPSTSKEQFSAKALLCGGSQIHKRFHKLALVPDTWQF